VIRGRGLIRRADVDGEVSLGDRSKLRYPNDLTDDEWLGVELLIPPAKRGGNDRHVDVREVMNGTPYLSSTGCRSGAERPATARHIF
jgi:hypothetical protein